MKTNFPKGVVRHVAVHLLGENLSLKTGKMSNTVQRLVAKENCQRLTNK